MLWHELIRVGNVSLLQSQSDTQYCVCSNYDPTAKEDNQYDNGSYFCYWNNEQKARNLFEAVNAFRCRTENDYISKWRMEELASKFADGLLQDDRDTAIEYFMEECEMTDCELQYFGIDVESEDDE